MINADEAKKMSQDGANSYSRFWIEKNIKEIEERIMRAAKRGPRYLPEGHRLGDDARYHPVLGR